MALVDGGLDSRYRIDIMDSTKNTIKDAEFAEIEKSGYAQYNPEIDTSEWQQLTAQNLEFHVNRVEKAYNVVNGTFLEIVNQMMPSETSVRMGDEIRFVWQNGITRETLEFYRPCHSIINSMTSFKFTQEINGVETVVMWDMAEDVVVSPPVGCRPPRILLTREFTGYINLTEPVVFLALMKRGYPPVRHKSQKFYMAWVG